MQSSSGSFVLRSMTFEGNIANYESAALHADNFGSLILTQSSFTNNTATAGDSAPPAMHAASHVRTLEAVMPHAAPAPS